jgi:hypothetical protein
MGPEVTVAIPPSGNALVTLTAQVTKLSPEQSSAMGFEVSGMTTMVASDKRAFIVPYFGGEPNLKGQASATYLVTGLVMGGNTFRAKYRVTGGKGTWQDRSIIVVPLP